MSPRHLRNTARSSAVFARHSRQTFSIGWPLATSSLKRITRPPTPRGQLYTDQPRSLLLLQRHGTSETAKRFRPLRVRRQCVAGRPLWLLGRPLFSNGVSWQASGNHLSFKNRRTVVGEKQPILRAETKGRRWPKPDIGSQRVGFTFGACSDGFQPDTLTMSAKTIGAQHASDRSSLSPDTHSCCLRTGPCRKGGHDRSDQGQVSGAVDCAYYIGAEHLDRRNLPDGLRGW
jgi:hypothetical protein